MEHIIDAQNKKVGRVASEAAHLLMGKNSTSYKRNAAPNVEVHITNAAKAAIDDKKKGQKIYYCHSGYPGGIKAEYLDEVIAKKGFREIFRRAVYGMLPTNKLRAKMIKNLKITD